MVAFVLLRDRGSADIDSFRAVSEDLTPLLDEVKLSGDMLCYPVQKKKPTAGSLDGRSSRLSRVGLIRLLVF